MAMLEGVNNNTLWAVWMWDSIQLPMGSMYGTQVNIGNYEQCLGPAWSADRQHPALRTQYCLVELNSPSVEEYNELGPFDNSNEYYRRRYFVTVFPHIMYTDDTRKQSNLHYIGVCLPSTCSSSSAAAISRHLLQFTHLPAGEVSVDPEDCVTAGEVRDYPIAFYVFWMLVLLLFAAAIISTLFCDNESKSTALSATAQSFCMSRNYRSLFTASADEVMSIHGLRVITAILILFYHEGMFSIMCPVINSLDITKVITSRVGQTTLHIDIVTDTFFVLSGLLLVKSLMAGHQRNLFYVLVKRYFRLIGPFALCVFYQTVTAKHMSSGPLWKKSVRMETDHCEKYWWKSLLMANTDIGTICHTVTWYISCDFQMTIFGTFLFYLFKRSRKVGIFVVVIVAAGLTVNLGFIAYQRQLDVVLFSFRTFIVKRKFVDLNDVYFSSFARAGPYLVGMIMGYVIAAYRPAEHRNIINKTWSVIVTIISLLLGFSMLAVGSFFHGRPYDALESAVVVATNRTLWGVMVCGLIAVCEYGSLSMISCFSWPGFVPLSKLTYCSYLLHPILLQLQKYSTRTLAQYSVPNFVYNACGVYVLSSALAVLLHLVLEAPAVNISNKIFTQKQS